MRGGGAIIELLIGAGITLLVAILFWSQVENYLPQKESRLSCQIVKEEIRCSNYLQHKNSRPK